jgi:hypothetical protein
LVILLVIAPPSQELESLGSRGGSPPKLTVFFDQAGEVTFSESLKVDRLILIVLETENFAGRPNFASKSRAENHDGVF